MGGGDMNAELPQPTIRGIQEAVCARYAVTMHHLLSDRRARCVARPRQVAMYLAHELTGRSLPVIGRAFNRDHTTIMHGIRQIRLLAEADADFGERVAALLCELRPAHDSTLTGVADG